MSLTFYCIDTETTGLSADRNEIFQLCAIRTDDRLQFDKRIRCLYPERAQAAALQITGTKLSDLQKGEEHSAVVESFEKYLQTDGKKPNGRCLIAHNAPFDRRFLHALWTKNNKSFPVLYWIDTIAMTRAVAKKRGIEKFGTKLEAACNMMGILKNANFHNAVVDTRNLYYLWTKLIEEEDYLQYIKPFPHSISKEEEEETELQDEFNS